MSASNFTTTLVTRKTSGEVFNSINNVSQWWSEDFKGNSQNLNDEFEVLFFGDVHYSKQKLIEVLPGKKMVWLVTESILNFLKNKSEWTGTKIIFEIEEDSDETKIRFTHVGLVPESECYKDCFNGWNYYLQSLSNYIDKGEGQPTKKGSKLYD
jgi:hypothetical protein